MPVPVLFHPACRLHDPGPGHPERPERIEAVLAALRAPEMAAVVEWCEARPATRDQVERVHAGRYLDALERLAGAGGGALAARAMGFCLINNVVVAARHAQHLGRPRVLIVDWDVHHGNGTQALVERDATIRYVSMHQYPWYPGTGAADERGVGNVFNVPRPPGLARDVYVRDLLAAVDAALADGGWRPNLLLVSAGFDSLAGDPLGGFTLEPADMALWTTVLRERVAPAAGVGLLEGGYRLDLLAAGAQAHVRALA